MSSDDEDFNPDELEARSAKEEYDSDPSDTGLGFADLQSVFLSWNYLEMTLVQNGQCLDAGHHSNRPMTLPLTHTLDPCVSRSCRMVLHLQVSLDMLLLTNIMQNEGLCIKDLTPVMTISLAAKGKRRRRGRRRPPRRLPRRKRRRPPSQQGCSSF